MSKFTQKQLPEKRLKFLTLLSSLYVMILLLTGVTAHKLIIVGGITASSATFVFPFAYFFEDIITEVYGYKLMRQLIWVTFLCMFLFDFTAWILMHLPSPKGLGQEFGYRVVFNPLILVFASYFIAMNIGSFINAYLLTKWKILTQGRYFWLRSIGASAIGEIVFTFILFTLMFSKNIPKDYYIESMLFSYAYKLTFTIVSAFPLAWITRIIKNKEGVDVFDYSTNFNPFRLDTKD
jgi:queuosine precursor transporter